MSTFSDSYTLVTQTGRKLVYSQVGENDSSQVLLCLPGLLETRGSYGPLLRALDGVAGLRVISVDLCGRGDSDPLPTDAGYSLSLYLSDIEALIQQEIVGYADAKPRLDILGTSMGGILGMYLAASPKNNVTGLLLNDVGLGLHWMSIYGLYESMKTEGLKPEAYNLASRLRVTQGALRDVQSPHHFDLPHTKNWKGMHFGQILKTFVGPLSLIYGGESGVCLPEQVQEMQDKFPQLVTLCIEKAKHPVPYSEAVCAFVLEQMQVKTNHQVLPDSSSEVRAAKNWRKKVFKWLRKKIK